MQIDIATLFPEMCDAVLQESILSRAQKSAKIRFFIISPSGSAQPPFLLPRHAPEKAGASSRNHACPLPLEMEPHTLSYFTR